MYLEKSRAILHISAIADGLATHSLNLHTFTSIHAGGPYCLLSSSVGISGTRGFQDPKCHLLAAVGIGTERLVAFPHQLIVPIIFTNAQLRYDTRG